MSIYSDYSHGLITESDFNLAATEDYGGCRPCNFSDNPSKKRCENCTSGDYWNQKIWREEEEEEVWNE